MTAQHRMTKAYPLACNCKPGWVSTFFLPTRTHPLACNCETGWVFFLFFFKSTNDDDDDEPCGLVVAVCLRLHPRQRRQPTPSLAIARRGKFFSSFFFKSTNDDNDNEPCRLVVVVCLRLHPRQRRQPTPSLAIARRGGFLSSFFSSQRTPTTMTSHVGSLSSSASVCTHDNDDNPPPRLQLRDGVGFFYPFFRVDERQPASVCTTTTTTTSHVGSSLSSASICTHDNPTTHPLACNCETGWGTPTTTTSHVGSSLSSASIVDPQRVITTCWGLSLPRLIDPLLSSSPLSLVASV